MKNTGIDGLVRLNLTLTCEEEEGGFASHCPELGVSSCGDTREEALENVREATKLHLETLADYGELHRYLEERGVSVTLLVNPEFTECLVPVNTSGALERTVRLEASGSAVLWDARRGEEPGQAHTGTPTIQYSLVL